MDNFFFNDILGICCIILFLMTMISIVFGVITLIRQKHTHLIRGSLASLLVTLCFVATGYTDNEPLFYVIIFSGSLVAFKLCLKLSITQTLFSSVFLAFHLLSLKSIAIGGYSLVILKNMYRIVNDDTLLKHVILISLGAMILVVLVSSILIKRNMERVKVFFAAKPQLRVSVTIHSFLTLFLLYFCYNYSFSLDIIWFSVAQLLTGVAVLGIYWVVMLYAAGMAYSLNRLREKQQYLDIDAQLANYKQYENALKSIQRMKHLYNEMMVSLKYLIDKNDNAEALRIISEQETIWDDTFLAVHQYSNNMMINALLLSYKNLATEKLIDFDAQVFIPEARTISDEELHDALSRILENSLTEAGKGSIQGKAAKIVIDSSFKNGWLSIRVANDCFSKIHMRQQQLNTEKKGDYSEGGLDIVARILDNHNGIVSYRYFRDKRIFTVTITVKC